MKEAKFWRIIEEARLAARPNRRLCQILTKLDAQELVSFQVSAPVESLRSGSNRELGTHLV
jgi:hypothetical protein